MRSSRSGASEGPQRQEIEMNTSKEDRRSLNRARQELASRAPRLQRALLLLLSNIFSRKRGYITPTDHHLSIPISKRIFQRCPFTCLPPEKENFPP